MRPPSCSDFNLALDCRGNRSDRGSQRHETTGSPSPATRDEARTIELTTRGEDLLRAVDLQGVLVAWVESELQTVLPGAGLELTDDGALIFRFPSVGATQTIGADDGLFFNTDDLGLGLAENLTLSARLSGEIDAMFTASAGIDLAGFGAQVAGGAGSPLDALSFGQNLSGALLDNVFLTDLAFSAQITRTRRGNPGHGRSRAGGGVDRQRRFRGRTSWSPTRSSRRRSWAPTPTATSPTG